MFIKRKYIAHTDCIFAPIKQVDLNSNQGVARVFGVGVRSEKIHMTGTMTNSMKKIFRL